VSKPTTYDAVVLAGGAGRRLGGVKKPALEVGGRRLLDVALDATSGAVATIVVGDPLSPTRPVTWAREEPVGGGPVAALAAGLAFVTSPTVVLLAADLPFVTARAVEDLVSGRNGASAVVAVDGDGRDQPLVGCYDAAAVRAALPRSPDGASMYALLRDLAATGVVRRVRLGGRPPVTWDCDTEADLSRARELA
jgi:molybdopterin-guanine dinucleotide biosynthesis protein A